MSIPSGVLRYAGIWNATDTYIPGMFVQSSLVDNSYAALAVVTGGSDPSVALAPDWVAFPSDTPVTSVNGITGAVALAASADDTFVVDTLSPPNIVFQWAVGAKGIYTEARTTPTNTATITAAPCTALSIIIATYVHPGTGGANHYIKAITPSNGSFTVLLNVTLEANDQINWVIVGEPNT
jgi:hypothetical protein